MRTVEIIGRNGAIDILMMIRDRDGETKSVYAEAAKVGTMTAYQRMRELEDAGMITSEKLRWCNASLLHITEKGRQVLQYAEMMERV